LVRNISEIYIAKPVREADSFFCKLTSNEARGCGLFACPL